MIWEEARALKEEYITNYVDKDVVFKILAPYGALGFEHGVHMSVVGFSEFTEEDKEETFEYYHQRWQEYGDKLPQ